MRSLSFWALGLAIVASASSARADDALKLGPPHLWLKAEAGLSVADLRAFHNAKPAPDGTAVGGVFGADVAIRWERISLGLRGRFHPLSDFNMWQIAPFVGIHFPQRTYDLSATAHIGYTAAVERGDGGVVARGAHGGVLVAFDYLVKAPVLIGVGVGSDVLLLGGAPSKSNVGIGATATLRLGLLL